jgi:hypothetical protein
MDGPQQKLKKRGGKTFLAIVNWGLEAKKMVF